MYLLFYLFVLHSIVVPTQNTQATLKGTTMNVDYKLIGERIQRVRKSRGMTQEIMAEKLDVSIGYVSQVERGITKISLDLLGAISSILDCDVASLISGSAVDSEIYLNSEIIEEISRLNSRQKKYILSIIKLTKEM